MKYNITIKKPKIAPDDLISWVISRLRIYDTYVTEDEKIIRKRPLTQDFCLMRENELFCILRRDRKQYCEENKEIFDAKELKEIMHSYIRIIAKGIREGDTSVAEPLPANVVYTYEDNMSNIIPSTPRMRPCWTDYFMYITEVVKLRSPDPKTQVGAVLTTDDNRIISTGYNALPTGMDESSIDWSERERDVYPRIVHAEANALLFAQSRFKNSVLYCTYSPCCECLKLMAAAGVTRIVFQHAYKDIDDVLKLAEELNIQVEHWTKPT